MREIKTSQITETVTRLFKEANFYLSDDVLMAIEKAAQSEESPIAGKYWSKLLKMQISPLKSNCLSARTAELL